MVETLTSGLTDALVARLILLANHVLASEPIAMQKLQPFAGRQIAISITSSASQTPLLKTLAAWLPPSVNLTITRAGLLELSEPTSNDGSNGAQGLSIGLDVPPPWSALQLLIKRERPAVTIEGDAALAEAASWLMKNLRWDLEDDLARWLGTTPSQVLKGMAEQVKAGLSRLRPGNTPR